MISGTRKEKTPLGLTVIPGWSSFWVLLWIGGAIGWIALVMRDAGSTRRGIELLSFAPGFCVVGVVGIFRRIFRLFGLGFGGTEWQWVIASTTALACLAIAAGALWVVAGLINRRARAVRTSVEIARWGIYNSAITLFFYFGL